MFDNMVEETSKNNQGNQQVSPIENILALSQVIDSKQAEIESKVEANTSQIASLTAEVKQLKAYIKQQTDALSKAAGG